MADSMSYPMLQYAVIVGSMQEFFPQESFAEADFKTPQAHRIQLAYSLLLEYVTGGDVSRFAQPQFAAMGEISNHEFAEGAVQIVHFALAMQRVMSACAAPEFRITDLLQPKPKKTRRFMSALLNFARFRDCRWEGYMGVKEEIGRVQEEHAGRMKVINSLKERINQIRAARAEEEDRVNQIEAEALEENQKLTGTHRAKEEMQKEISHIKTTIAEKYARLEQQKVSILTSQDCVNKLKTQVVQSPERMKADIARMQAALVSCKQTKVDKCKRIQELQSQADSAAVLMSGSEQSTALTESISQLLAKQKESLDQVEQVRDQLQGQQGVLTDATHREGHFSRLKESKQEKLTKLQLQHQHAAAAWHETIERNQRELEDWKQKNEKVCEQLKCFEEPMLLLQREIADKENLHEEEIKGMKHHYNSMLQAIDSYHDSLAREWDTHKPKDHGAA